MSVLSDRDIRAALEAGTIKIEPYDPEDIQPSSVDLHLDRSFRVFRNNRYPYIDVRAPQPDLTEMMTIEDDEPFILHPGEFVLGQTLEFVELPNDIVSRLEGKSLALDTPVPTPSGWRTMGDSNRVTTSSMSGSSDAGGRGTRRWSDDPVARSSSRMASESWRTPTTNG